KRTAQPRDVDVDGSEGDVFILRPDEVQQLLPREYPARMFDQMPEQPEFGGADIERRAPSADVGRRNIHFEIRKPQRMPGKRRPDAPQDSSYACDQLARRERLRDIVVGAGFKTADPVGLVAPSAE